MKFTTLQRLLLAALAVAMASGEDGLRSQSRSLYINSEDEEVGVPLTQMLPHTIFDMALTDKGIDQSVRSLLKKNKSGGKNGGKNGSKSGSISGSMSGSMSGSKKGRMMMKKLTKSQRATKRAKQADTRAKKKEKRDKKREDRQAKNRFKMVKAKKIKAKMMMMMKNREKSKELEKKIPGNCELRKEKVEVPCPEPPKDPLPKKCAGVSASWSGDPHFRTFDKVKFDCQGEGEFQVVGSVQSNFSLQGRFKKFTESSRPTVTKSIALDTDDGFPIIQVNVPDSGDEGCSPYMFVGKERMDVSKGEQTIDGIRIKTTKTMENEGLIFFYEKTEVQLQVWAKKSRTNGCVLAAEICIPDCYDRRTEDFVGLLGSPDKDPTNDWTEYSGSITSPGSTLEFSLDKADQTEYCTENWCIYDAADSLFVYETDKGESFESLNQCDLGPDTKTLECIADPPEEIEKICGFFDEACLVDGCIGGEEGAEAYVIATLGMADHNCGTEILSEDFEGDDVSAEWGDIMKKEATEMSAEATSFLHLGGEGMSSSTLSVDIPEDITLVTLEFLFYEIGGWDMSGESADTIVAIIEDIEIDLGTFDGKTDDELAGGVVDGIQWITHPMTKSGDLGFAPQGSGQDQIHKVTLKIPAAIITNGQLSFGFGVDLKQDSEERAGIDEISIIAYKESCAISCEGAMVVNEDFNDGDQSDWGAVIQMTDGHTVLGPLKDDSQPISKVFPISAYANSVQIDFRLYEISSWAGNDENKFLITVGKETFDLGLGIFSAEDDKAGAFATGDAGENNGIHWDCETKVTGADLGFDSSSGKIHTVRIDVSREYFESGLLYISYDVQAGSDGIAAGIDDFKIFVYPDKEECEAAKVKALALNYCPEPEPAFTDTDQCYETKQHTECSPTAAPDPTNTPTVAPNASDPTNTPTVAPNGAPSNRSFTPAPSRKEVKPSPNPVPPAPPTFMTGDPHIKKWDGVTYDFHGGCDLVLLSNPGFNNGQGLYIHVRTKITRWWSSIESAAIRIGDDVFEVKSGIQDRPYWLNGEEGEPFITSMELPFTIGGFSGRYRYKDDSVIQYKLRLDNNQTIMIRSVKDMLRVEFDGSTADDFGDSLGLMGSFGNGDLIGRDGTVFDDIDAFGNEWQVNSDDPQLFHTADGPQFPEKCTIPAPEVSETRRRLGSSISRAAAEKACAGVVAGEKKMCVDDVMQMDDVDAALGY